MQCGIDFSRYENNAVIAAFDNKGGVPWRR
jgi:hypothetical protein